MVVSELMLLSHDKQVKGNFVVSDIIFVSIEQIRDARALLRWSVRELCERTRVGDKAAISQATYVRLESGKQSLDAANFGAVRQIVRALEMGGIEFLRDGSVRKVRQAEAGEGSE